MAEAGKLRLRDGRLVVEAMGGRILAEVEPDDGMRIEHTLGSIFSLFSEATDTPIPITVTWMQVVEQERGFIDAEAVEVDPERPELGPGS